MLLTVTNIALYIKRQLRMTHVKLSNQHSRLFDYITLLMEHNLLVNDDMWSLEIEVR